MVAKYKITIYLDDELIEFVKYLKQNGYDIDEFIRDAIKQTDEYKDWKLGKARTKPNQSKPFLSKGIYISKGFDLLEDMISVYCEEKDLTKDEFHIIVRMQYGEQSKNGRRKV